MKQVELMIYEFEYRGVSRLIALFGISSPWGFRCTKYNQYFVMGFSNESGSLEIETFKDEIKSVVLE